MTRLILLILALTWSAVADAQGCAGTQAPVELQRHLHQRRRRIAATRLLPRRHGEERADVCVVLPYVLVDGAAHRLL